MDYTSAAATLMFNLTTMDYDDLMLQELGIPRSILPKPVRTGSCVVNTDPEECFGLTVPIGASAGDQNSATFAQACIEPGMMKNTYGTGSFMLLNTGDKKITKKECGLFVEPLNNINGDLKFCLEGYANVSGSAIQWLRDGLGIVANAAEADQAGKLRTGQRRGILCTRFCRSDLRKRSLCPRYHHRDHPGHHQGPYLPCCGRGHGLSDGGCL